MLQISDQGMRALYDARWGGRSAPRACQAVSNLFKFELCFFLSIQCHGRRQIHLARIELATFSV